MKKFTDKINESVEDKIPSAEGFWMDKTGNTPNQEEFTAMIEFAKLHVEQALLEASKRAEVKFRLNDCPESFERYDYTVNKESILNSYPLTNIK